MDYEQDREQEESYSFPSAILAAIMISVAWIVISASYIAQAHQVPSLIDYKAAYVNYAACGGQQAGMAGLQIQDCLERQHQQLVSAWKKDVGTVVAIPPLLAWAGLGGALALGWGRAARRSPI